MDIFCLIVLLLNGISGFAKGLVKMLFSLIGIIVVGFITYKLIDVVYASGIGESIYSFLYETIESTFNNVVAGEFSSVDDLITALGETNLNAIVLAVVSLLLKGVTIEGSFTCGILVADVLTPYVTKVIIFAALYISIFIVVKLARVIIEKLIKKAGLSFANRVLGLLFGLIKGVIICALILFVLSALSSFISPISTLLESGQVSSYIYNNIFLKVFNFFYSKLTLA